ncbi:MAG: hypothetical protein VZQ50_02035, partial [Lachnospiraceae bacterium]|nr:hypothetical protein [Lachnospiraceae bacterium]
NETSTTDTNNNKLCFTGRDANIVLGSIDKNILTPMMQYLYLKELTRTIYDIPKLIEKLYSDEEYINCTNIKARESYFKMFLKKHSKTYPALDNFVVSNKKRDYFLTQQGGFAYYTLKLLLQHIPDCVWKAYKQNQTPDLTYLMKDYCGNNTYEQKIEQIKCEFFPKNI